MTTNTGDQPDWVQLGSEWDDDVTEEATKFLVRLKEPQEVAKRRSRHGESPIIEFKTG